MTLQNNPFSKWEDKPDPEIPTATLQIYNFIDTYLARGDDRHVNRASAASMCFRRRWYQRNGYPSTPLTPRKRVNFLLGDLSEKTMQYFIKEGCVGPSKLYSEVDFGRVIGQFFIQGKVIEVYQQEDLTAKIGDIEVTAHVDGWGKRNLDGEWELIECKSAADYGFDSFKESGPGDYNKQACVNMQTTKAKELGVKSVRFFYLKKNTGHLWDALYYFDQALANEVIEEFKLSNQEALPKRPYAPIVETFRSKPTGKKKLYWACHYCPYTQECWPEAELVFKNDKPIWYLKE